MNDLGLTLAWLAVQVAILLAPALVLNALALRRGPASSAWVAVLSLGLVVFLNVAAFLPRIGWNKKADAPQSAVPAIALENTAISNNVTSSLGPDDVQPAGRRRLVLDWLGAAWDRLGRGVTEPATRVRPWASALAAFALAGTAVGLVRLTIGLWAVALCRRCGRPVNEPRITGLLEELRCAMGCRQPVSLREVADLTTPATAGRRRPLLLLPGDWQMWSDAELRAVLAHELAHIVRGDYTTGLLAWLAVVCNYYHPLVRLMAGRLQLQQEQAADAMGAQFAGGRARYLLALSSLALRQDGQSPRWPARAFLPARRTLIRRIAMLRDESNSKLVDRPLSSARRVLTFMGLVGLTISVATLRGPARGVDDGPSHASQKEVAPPQPRDPSISFVTPYVREGSDGVVVFRPAAALRHKGMDRLLALFQTEVLNVDFSMIARELKVDTLRPGFLNLRPQDIDWVSACIDFGRSVPNGQLDKHRPPSGAVDESRHTIRFGTPSVRMLMPFDWLAYLRQWRFEFEEVRLKGHRYFRITGKLRQLLGPNPCVFVPDDRSIVLDEEDVIRTIAAGEDPAPPSYVRGKQWERATSGLIAIAINNQNDTFAKHYDFGQPDDAMLLPLFKGLDTWIFGVEDADPIVLQADAACRDRGASEAISRSLDSLIKLGGESIEQNLPESPDAGAQNQIAHMLKALAANVRVEHTDSAVTVHAEGFGTLADFASIVNGDAQESKARVAAANDPKNSVKK